MPTKKKSTKIKKSAKGGSASGRKKTTTRKTTTKSSSRTKKATKKKSVKKKVVKKTEQVVDVKHASEVHTVTTKHIDLSVPKTPKKSAFSKGFSFPSALSQVRDSVQSQSIVEQGVVQPVQQKAQKKQVEESSFVSPYVLDLRQQKTLLHGVKPAAKKVEAQQEPKEQSILSLFESPKKQSSLSDSVKNLRSFGQQFSSQKHTNFAPIQHKFQPGTALRRLNRGISWRISYQLGRLKQPFVQAKSRKLQKTIAMPKQLGKTTPSWLTQQTRSGKPIAVSVLSRLKKEQKAETKTRSKELPTFTLPSLEWRRMAMSFAGLCLLFVLPIGGLSLYQQLQEAQGDVYGATTLALEELEKAQLHATNLDFTAASEYFDQAGQAFQAAAAVMDNRLGISSEIVSVIPVVGDKVETAKLLLAAGNDLSESAALLTQAVDVLNNSEHFLAEEDLSFKLEFLFVRIAESAPLLASATEHLQQVDLSQLPDEFQGKVSALKETMPVISNQFSRLASLESALLPFIGHDSLQRYLVVFQNNTELRATGGFFGSLALVDLDLGEIQNIEVPGGGPYDYQGSFLDFYQAPRALQLLTPRWELQDANWFLDWPTSAETIASFYEKAGGPSVDGVIAINTQVLEGLLALVGPIELPEYQMTIDTENFRALLQEEVEFNYDKEANEPKKIIADMVPIVLEKVKDLEPHDYLALGQTFSALLEQKEIFIQHEDPEVQEVFSTLGWSGEVIETEADYLAVVHTNLAGGKTDGVIQDEYQLDVHIDARGDVTNTLTIRRAHSGTRGVPLTGVRNVDYLRVYVPEGSELISATHTMTPPAELFESPQEDWLIAQNLLPYQSDYSVHEPSGVEIFKESGKTVFGQWVQLDPQEVAEVKLVYKVASGLASYAIPEREDSWTDWITGKTAHSVNKVNLYRLYWQKQSGAWDPELDVTINYPQQWQARSESTVAGTPGPGIWQSKAQQTGDSVWSLLMY